MSLKNYFASARREINEMAARDMHTIFTEPVRLDYFRPVATLLSSPLSLQYIYNGMMNSDLPSLLIGYTVLGNSLVADAAIGKFRYSLDASRKGQQVLG